MACAVFNPQGGPVTCRSRSAFERNAAPAPVPVGPGTALASAYVRHELSQAWSPSGHLPGKGGG